MACPPQNVAKIQRQILEASRHRFQLNRKSFLEIEMFYEKEKTVSNVAVYNMIVSNPCRFGKFFFGKTFPHLSDQCMYELIQGDNSPTLTGSSWTLACHGASRSCKSASQVTLMQVFLIS